MKLKNIIKSVLNEEVSKILNEDITSGRAIVYHRAGKYGSPIAGIAEDGYRVGSGAMYGVGVYTTYNLESQLTDYMEIYGNIIIECKINTLDKFLIFDYDIAKKIYGNRNYTLDRQLRLILGNEWKEYKNNYKLKDLVNEIHSVEYTSDVAYPFYVEFKNTIIKKLRGLIFTGSRDGNVLVSYDRKNVEPIRYSENNGETWKNILNKNIYKRIKNFNPKEDLRYHHILNYIDTWNIYSPRLSEDDIKFIEKNIDLFINRINVRILQDVLPNSSNPDIIIDKVIEAKGDNLSEYIVGYLIYHSSNQYAIIDRLINVIGDKINSHYIEPFIKSSFDKDATIDKILNIDNYKLIPYDIRLILKHSSNQDAIVDKIIDIKGDRLDSDDINELLYDYSDKDRLIDRIIKLKGDSLDEYTIDCLLKYSSSPDSIIDRIINSKGYKLTLVDVYYLFEYSSDKNSILDKIIKATGDKFDKSDLDYLLKKFNEEKK
jgi:hypothetical protein